MKKSRKRGACAYLLFVTYTALMIWLLFGQRTKGDVAVENLNFTPFETLKLYADLLKNSKDGYLVRHAFINLVGNVVMFIPLGYFLPMILPKCKNFLVMLFCAVLVIVLIESVQFITALGSCDIDDLILNVPGIIIGWCFYRVQSKKCE